jgi:dTDP-glucose 4,6-dehydratase
MKKVLILGTSSFGGAATADFLLNKNFLVLGTYRRKKNSLYQPQLHNLKSKNFRDFKIDLDLEKDISKLIKIIDRYKPKYIVDFASICMVNQSWSYPEKYFKSNVEKKSLLIKKLCNKKFIRKYIYISTPEIFGSSPKPVKETSKFFNPSTPYAISKLSFEMILKSYGDYYNFPYIICRFSNFFGIGQPNYRLVPKVFLNIFSKKKFYLEGRGETKRNFIESYDFSNGIYLTLKKGKLKNRYHFSSNKFVTIKEIVQIIYKLKSENFKKFVRYTKDRKGKDQVYILDCKKTIKSLGWRPKINLIQSLKKIESFYKKNFSKLKNLESRYRDNNLSR